MHISRESMAQAKVTSSTQARGQLCAWYVQATVRRPEKKVLKEEHQMTRDWGVGGGGVGGARDVENLAASVQTW